MFSPWYAWSGRRDPANHCCINVATYGRGGRFAMTDRGRMALRKSPTTLTIGPSSLRWTGQTLIIDIDEISSLPLVSRVRGQITVTPGAVTDRELLLHPDGSHIWRPFAPCARISVDMGPGWEFDGQGYLDANFGTRALERDFSYWTWGRFPLAAGTACFYDATRRDGSRLATGMLFTPDGRTENIPMPPRTAFKPSCWQVRRETRADSGHVPHQIKAMLDAPFYSRSVVETKLNGETTKGVHEALDLDRFSNPLVKPMLAVRVPRRRGWTFPDQHD